MCVFVRKEASSLNPMPQKNVGSVSHTCLSSSRVEIRRVCGGVGEANVFERDDVGTAAGAIGAVGAVAVAVMGASRSGSVMVVSWDVFMPETSKSELASGETDLRSPVVVGCDADGSFCIAGQHYSPSHIGVIKGHAA